MSRVLRSACLHKGGLRGYLQSLQNVQNNAESKVTAQNACRNETERPPRAELIVITTTRIFKTWNASICFKKLTSTAPLQACTKSAKQPS